MNRHDALLTAAFHLYQAEAALGAAQEMLSKEDERLHWIDLADLARHTRQWKETVILLLEKETP